MRKLFYFTLALVYAATLPALSQEQKKPKASRPNILFIVIDDASWSLSPPNEPSYVALPGFDSVRLNGVTVNSAFCNYPLCNPSRYSFLTGLYAHTHGAYDNSTRVNPVYRLFTQAFDDAGYHVQVCGKFTNTGYKYQNWAENKRWMTIQRIAYKNPIMFFSNGKSKTVTGNTTTIIGDTTNKWLASIDTPFIFWEGMIVPHSPTTPLPTTKGKFKQDYIPLKSWVPYMKDYPTFQYTNEDKYFQIADSNQAQKQCEHNYECYVDIDSAFTKQFATLRSRGLLDNTMIVIINDNGYENGEHLLNGKEKPYKENLGLPCYIRWKQWFNPGTTIDSEMFTSLDVGATLLDAAGIHDAAYNAQTLGTSIRNRIAQGKRDSIFYYEDIRRTEAIITNQSQSPSFRGVRTFAYNYVIYHCDTITEQLFDLKKDPNEMQNVVRQPSYQSVVARYRFLYDSLANVTHDSVPSDTFYLPCTLTSVPPPVRSGQMPVEGTVSSSVTISLSPNPADESLFAEIASRDDMKGSFKMIIRNSLGTIVSSQKMKAGPITTTTIDVHNFAEGVYFMNIEGEGVSQTKPFIVIHDDE